METTIEKIKEVATNTTDPTVIVGSNGSWYKTTFREFFAAVNAELDKDSNIKDTECVHRAVPGLRKAEMGVSGRVSAHEMSTVSAALKRERGWECNASVKNYYIDGKPWVYEQDTYGLPGKAPALAIIQLRSVG